VRVSSYQLLPPVMLALSNSSTFLRANNSVISALSPGRYSMAFTFSESYLIPLPLVLNVEIAVDTLNRLKSLVAEFNPSLNCSSKSLPNNIPMDGQDFQFHREFNLVNDSAHSLGGSIGPTLHFSAGSDRSKLYIRLGYNFLLDAMHIRLLDERSGKEVELRRTWNYEDLLSNLQPGNYSLQINQGPPFKYSNYAIAHCAAYSFSLFVGASFSGDCTHLDLLLAVVSLWGLATTLWVIPYAVARTASLEVVAKCARRDIQDGLTANYGRVAGGACMEFAMMQAIASASGIGRDLLVRKKWRGRNPMGGLRL